MWLNHYSDQVAKVNSVIHNLKVYRVSESGLIVQKDARSNPGLGRGSQCT
jgi:hypothetical protein